MSVATSAPVHAVHTLHGISSASRSTYAGVVVDMPDRQPTGLARAVWRAIPVPPGCRRLPTPPDARRPSPVRTTTAQPVEFPVEDPFDDRHTLHPPTVQNGQLVPYQRTRLASQSFTVKLPRASPLETLVRQRTAQRLAQDREARCKVVAGILLHRVHAVGKPMRRAPPHPDLPRTYTRSRLSTMVTVEDLP